MELFETIACSGSPYEMGVQQGEALREPIHAFLKTFEQSEEFRASAGRVVGAEGVLRMLGGIATLAQRFASGEALGPWRARLEGIADGAKMNRPVLWGAQIIEALISSPLAMSGCTSIAVGSRWTGGAGPLLLKNYDIGEMLRPTTCLRRSRPSGRLASFDMVINALVGSHVTMNEAGLCLSYNYGMVRWYPRPGVPPTYLVQHAAENFTGTDETADWLSKQTSTNGCVITVMDRDDRLCVVEKAGRHGAVRRDEDGMTVATNHFLTDGMSRFNYALTTVYGKRTSSSIRGMSVQASNVARLERARRLLAEASSAGGRISADRLMAIARDHDGKVGGDENTICRHHEGMMTLASIILVPRERKVLLCAGNPCEGTFEEIANPFD
jgi:hypothetical protein